MIPAVETAGLSKSFGDQQAVTKLDLVVPEGQMFALVGPDGAGKTTTIRMLCGLLTPTSGSAAVLGYDVLREPDRVKHSIGYLSQRFSLYGDLSVDENIEFFAEINLVYQYEERREELLRLTRLLPFRDRLAERLSGGMKQKLALACTLIHTPRLLFLDEPTTGVDPVSRRDFWRILHTLQSQGLSIVMTTPYLDEAERCGRMGMLNEGRLMVTGTPSEVRALMKHEILEVVCHPVRNARQILLGHPRIKEIHMFGDRLNILVADAANDGRVIETYLKSHGLAVTSWRKIPPSIENVFISLVGLRETEEAHL